MAKRRSRRKNPAELEVSAVAQRMADRISPDTVGMPIASIATLLTVILPMLFSRCGGDTPDDPAEVQAAIAQQHKENPESLANRTAAAVMREARANRKRISKADALVTADAMIAETLESHAEDVGAFCANMV